MRCTYHAAASCLLPPLPGLFPRVHYAYRLIAATIPPPFWVAISIPAFFTLASSTRKGLFGIYLDTALLAFAHLGARHALTVVLWMGHDSDLPLSCASARDAYPSAVVASLITTLTRPSARLGARYASRM